MRSRTLVEGREKTSSFKTETPQFYVQLINRHKSHLTAGGDSLGSCGKELNSCKLLLPKGWPKLFLAIQKQDLAQRKSRN